MEFVKNPDGLRPREDADRFDWVACTEGPSTFLWATVVVPDLVDRDRGRLTFVFGVPVVPLSETFCTLDWSFFTPAGEGMHKLRMVAKMKRIPSMNSSTGWRSWID